ncbi:MAG TPA: DUF1592 domain-containing protein [Tepidisphaeraceae bacterium]|nr:DUF1592 domain-containing protein [Tepidisphaeraceae bacterium]
MRTLVTSAVCLVVAAGVLLAGAGAALAADDGASFEKDVRPVLQDNCITCHNPQKKKGDLDLSRFQTTKAALSDELTWQNVAARLREGDMPPKKAPRKPTPDERRAVLDWIQVHIESAGDCEKIATDKNSRFYRGYVMSRRLTRAEYDDTIRDLIGVEFHLADLLPADGSGGEGFDTDGDALFTSTISLEKYLQAANQVMQAVLPDHDESQSDELREARDRLLIAQPGPNLSASDAARRVLANFAGRAFRRPITESELDRFVVLFDRAHARGESFAASIRLALKAVLISPNFLFLVEPEPEQDGVYRLGDYQIATRLSYFLWSSMPDQELFRLAGEGRLHEPDVMRAQVLRMLKDPRSIALAENFGTQWLGITALGVTRRPDPGRFPQFDDELAASEKEEVVRFVDSVFRNDRSLLELIDANYTFVNEKLARIYGIPHVHGRDLRRVELANGDRGGVVSMAAVLTATSYPLRTSPVLRGRWVLEQLLGERIPPPPPTSGQLPADDRQPDGLSFRQRLERHRSDPQCASCHSRMDPIGFGLENFDAIGRFRTTEAGSPVDASGILPDGTRFEGPQQLKQVLLTRKTEFLRNFTRKLAGYALGRGLNRFDECVIKEGLDALKGSDNEPCALIQAIVLSKPFQYRYAKH